MRNFTLLFALIVTLICSPCQEGFSQSNNSYERVVAIDTSKQDGSKKLILLFNIKEKLEHDNLTRDTGYILALLKIAKYENEVHQDIPKAISYTTQSLQILQTTQQHTSNLLANIYFNLAIYYYNIRIYDQAKKFFDKTIEISSSEHLQAYYFEARFYGAVIDDLLGDYEKVEKESRLAMAEFYTDSDSINYNFLLYLHCRSIMFQDKLQPALNEAKQLETNAKRTGDKFVLCNAYNLQAKIYNRQKNYKAAEQLYQLAYQTRLSVSDNNATSIDCSDLATLYSSGLADYRKANFYYRKSIFYGSKCPVEKRSRLFLMSYGNLGKLYVTTNQFDSAVACYNKALETVNIKTPDFLFSNPPLKQLLSIGEKDLILSIFTSKCKLLLDLFEKTKNKAYLQQCINTAIVTDSLIVQMRHEQEGDKSKLYWRDQTHSFFSKAIEACYLSGNIEKAVFFMEKSRSVLLNDKLNELNSSFSYLPEQMILSENKIANEINELQTRLIALSASIPDYINTLKTLEKKQDELNRYIKSLEKNYPLYYQYKYADDVPSLDEINHYVKTNDQSLVYYFAGDSAMYALAITKNGNHFIKVPAQSFDSRQLSQFTNLCSNRQENNSNYTTYATLAHNIYQTLFEPLHLPAGNVVICTDNFFIPFDALCSDEKGKKFLLYKYDFSYTYSARTLLKPFKSGAKPEGNFIGFAPISFSEKLNVFPLNGSASALQKSADCYGNNLLFTDRYATRSSFFKHASQYSVLTIFSHAQADTTDKEPVLYMQDSLIHLSELQMLNNPATQLVLLSACQTNTGKNATGEGIYSLARGFASAGIPSVSATLWKADEETIYRISEKFNENLAKGMNKSAALQQAKIWYLQNSNREHALPFYWANLVLIGSSDPVSLTHSNHTWLWLLAISAVIILIAFMIISKYKKRTSAHFIA